jgi:hypothetical protein
MLVLGHPSMDGRPVSFLDGCPWMAVLGPLCMDGRRWIAASTRPSMTGRPGTVVQGLGRLGTHLGSIQSRPGIDLEWIWS